ncbi:UDP-glucose 4-epimerase GalE [Desulfurivibrio sp. D14AmB]|uniref:UDP-glucose 4-epimerase GalE n=1 Tax=Desulfurivibrio sp. D14AmB TaxID=3374370 RepID=UPI00376F22E2
MNILITGGNGYIGSHACLVLQQAGHGVVSLDNLSNSRADVAERVARISGRPLRLVEGDVRDRELLERVLRQEKIEAVFHFAGLKAVGESVSRPLRYYDCNVGGAVALCRAMAAAAVKVLVFSSSATVYGEPARMPVAEDCPLGEPTNPYGRSKLMIEQILADLSRADPSWRIARLRYFNPVGAHESGLIGEDPSGEPANLMPYVAQVAAGKRESLQVFGTDYPTADGTGVRDYIHVMDLVEGHLAALEYLRRHPGLLTVNLGTGRGLSVLEMAETFARVSGRPVPYRVTARRPGDVAACWADPALAQRLLGWRAQRSVEDMCRDTWRWVSGGVGGARE